MQAMDHAEKLYGKPRIFQQKKRQATRQRDRPHSLEEKTQNLFGLEPGIRRATFIPTPAGGLAGDEGPIDWTDWTAPEILYGLAKTFALPGHALDGGSFTQQDTTDAAFNLTGGGFLSSAALPKTGAKGATILGMGGARTPFYKRSTSSVKEFATEIEKVLKTKDSSKGKVFREDLGEITIDFGNSQKGLDHIIKKRTNVDKIDGEAFVREQLPEILAKGRLFNIKGPSNGRRALLVTPKGHASLSLFRYEKKEVWLVTGYVPYE